MRLLSFLLIIIFVIFHAKGNVRLRDPVFPSRFIAEYTDKFDPLGNDTVKMASVLDVINQRAVTVIDNTKYYLLYNPVLDNRYLLLSKNAAACWYETGPFIIQYPFPRTWFKDNNVTIGSFVDLPINMVYKGVEIDNDILVDRWNSIELCVLKKWNLAPMPCISYMTVKNTSVPHKYIQAHQKSGPFDNDYYFTRTFDYFSTDIRDKDFEIPSDWSTSCYDYNNAITIKPERGYVCTPESNDQFTVTLDTRPIDQLGDVSVMFIPTPTKEYNCTSCTHLIPPYITFNSDNWNVPVPINVLFTDTGLSRFVAMSKGGGYDHVAFVPNIIVASQTYISIYYYRDL